MFKTLKQHFRILPMVIFMATLMLSVRINNLFDMLKTPQPTGSAFPSLSPRPKKKTIKKPPI